MFQALTTVNLLLPSPVFLSLSSPSMTMNEPYLEKLPEGCDRAQQAAGVQQALMRGSFPSVVWKLPSLLQIRIMSPHSRPVISELLGVGSNISILQSSWDSSIVEPSLRTTALPILKNLPWPCLKWGASLSFPSFFLSLFLSNFFFYYRECQTYASVDRSLMNPHVPITQPQQPSTCGQSSPFHTPSIFCLPGSP